MNLGLDGKRVLIAGASRGIGLAIAHAFAQEGADLAVIARGADDLGRAATALAAHGRRVAPIVADVAQSTEAARAVADAVAVLGGLDIVIANVGKSYARHADGLDDADLAASLDANLWAAHRVVRAARPHLAAGASVTLIASIWGREAGGSPGYNAAKAALIALGKALARDWAAAGIRVNTVAPGSILFPGGGWERRQQADPSGIADFVTRELPLGRFGRPDEVADTVAFVASPRASWINGACIVVDGGQSRAF